MGCPCYAFHYITDDAALERASLLRRIARDRGFPVTYEEFDEYHAIVVKVRHSRLREFCDEMRRDGLVLHGIDVSTSEQRSIVESRGQRAFVNTWPVNPKWIGDRYPAGSPPSFKERRTTQQRGKK